MAVSNGEITRITIAPYRGTTALEADVYMLAEGRELRRRWKSPHGSRTSTERWAREKARVFLARQAAREKEPAPTFAAFAGPWVEDHILGNRLRPSTAASMRVTLREHLLPMFGKLRLDEISDEQVTALKKLDRESSTINRILQFFKQILRAAQKKGHLVKLPEIKLLKVHNDRRCFYQPEDYTRFVEAAASDPKTLVLVLLAGDAGLREGEITALDWSQVDYRNGKIHVVASEWNGIVGPPKGGKSRSVPMTPRLRAALEALPVVGTRVLTRNGKRRGDPVGRGTFGDWLEKAQKAANVQRKGIHTLRHTFCSHLAMAGAPVTAIRDLAGHSTIVVTQRYMHLAPQNLTSAIDLLAGLHGSARSRSTSNQEKGRRNRSAPPKTE